MPQRRSDVLEMIAERALMFGIGGIVALAGSYLFYSFRGDGYTIGLIWVLAVAGVISILLALYSVTKVRKVTDFSVECPYCKAANHLLEKPREDFTCGECHRLVPVIDGQILPVFQVRCGFCNTLNYYSDKSEALICEECDREIPIAVTGESGRNLPRGFVIQDDPNLYELVLVAPGNKTEEVISALQHMLALNRSQVKNILAEAPVTLLTGITRRKAEMLQAQLAVHDAAAEFRPLQNR